jgi:zinc/manganese transport system substrate-binding protein
MRRRYCPVIGVLLIGALVGTACSNDSDNEASGERGVVVVTYSALGSLVADIVDDAAVVEVLVPNGMDPHDFEPSARDVETLTRASLVVANGLDLEEGLEDAIGEAEKSGTPVFFVTDHVTLRTAEDEHSEEGETEDDHGHGGEDPHVWLDPSTMAEAVPALAAEIGNLIGADLSANADALVSDLASLSEEIATEIDTLQSCVLLTGHDSLGYFGARYGCEIVGSIVPGFSTAAEATAGELAELKKAAESKGVKAIFTEQGTPREVAERIAAELKVDVIELPHHRVPGNGGYREMMENLARTIVDGLA